MKFNIDNDSGDAIRLWMTLDHPSDVPSLLIKTGSNPPISISANFNRPDLREYDLHATGQAGFVIDETIVPDLPSQTDLVLSDKTSGIPIYARTLPEVHLRRKIFIWSRSAEVTQRDATSLLNAFSLVYFGLDEHSLETISSIIGNQSADSILAVGRVSLLRFSDLLERQGFEIVFLIGDPYVDLAERLVTLGAMNTHNNLHPSLSSVAARLQDVDVTETRHLTRFFRTIEGNEKLMFRSPVVRGLTRAPEEDVRRQDVPTALRILSKYNFVCTDQTVNLMATRVEGLSALANPPVHNPDVMSLAERLRDIGAVSDIINEDAALYHYVSRAVATAQHRLQEMSTGTI